MCLAALAAVSVAALGQAELPDAKPIPRLQAVPLPYYQISFQRDEKEIARYYFDPSFNRPFIFPLIGPSGRTLTRMGHPGDPDTHSHHNSVWAAYSKVNGVDFWSDPPGPNHGRIIHRRIVKLEDGDDRAGAITQADWTADAGAVLLHETRGTWVYALPHDEWLLVVDLRLEAAAASVTFDRAGFGPMSVRVAKSIAVQYGGGRLRNSEGGEGEKQIFRLPARWVDYSGLTAPGIVEGLTLMDHPLNPGYPSPFHVRADGWMGAMLSTQEATVVTRAKPLHLRYGVYVHAGLPTAPALEAMWKDFTNIDVPAIGPER
jgi:hypothetical protein